MNLSSSIQAQKTFTCENWAYISDTKALDRIHEEHLNIVLQNRNIETLDDDIKTLINKDIQLKHSGTCNEIFAHVSDVLNHLARTSRLCDINDILHQFKKVTKVDKFRLLLGVIHTNMCRRFHTDINEIRLLCTYNGPGTLWLKNDNINYNALNNGACNEEIIINRNLIQQAKIGSILLLKGERYPFNNSNAVVHMSPNIEKERQKRLLLRIDIDESLKL